MNILTKIAYFIICFTLASASCAGVSDKPVISVNKVKYKDYYHLELNLNNIPFTFSNDEKDRNYSPYSKQMLSENGGQFEILIPIEHFPVAAPNCKSNIILRMPWTNPSLSKSEHYIKEKYLIFQSLKTKQNNLKVVLELNPYVKAISNQPLIVELQNCNAFFRHSRGKYINYLGPVK